MSKKNIEALKRWFDCLFKKETSSVITGQYSLIISKSIEPNQAA
jgi:hypothetical protein